MAQGLEPQVVLLILLMLTNPCRAVIRVLGHRGNPHFGETAAWPSCSSLARRLGVKDPWGMVSSVRDNVPEV